MLLGELHLNVMTPGIIGMFDIFSVAIAFTCIHLVFFYVLQYYIVEEFRKN